MPTRAGVGCALGKRAYGPCAWVGAVCNRAGVECAMPTRLRDMYPLRTERNIRVERVVVTDIKDIGDLHCRRAEVTASSHDCFQDCILRVFRWNKGFHALSLRYHDARRSANAFPNRCRIQSLFPRIGAVRYRYVLCVKNLLHFSARSSAAPQICPIYHDNSSTLIILTMSMRSGE